MSHEVALGSKGARDTAFVDRRTAPTPCSPPCHTAVYIPWERNRGRGPTRMLSPRWRAAVRWEGPTRGPRDRAAGCSTLLRQGRAEVQAVDRRCLTPALPPDCSYNSSFGESFFALAAPPIFPALLAALASRVRMSSSISPVAMRITLTALPMTSAGRFSPLGPRGIFAILA